MPTATKEALLEFRLLEGKCVLQHTPLSVTPSDICSNSCFPHCDFSLLPESGVAHLFSVYPVFIVANSLIQYAT
jgi:hypothetical protein